MRVIAGRWRGRRLVSAPPGVRPSSDRVRERLFGVLEPRLPGARIVDLYCGTGSLGIEALSRGAVAATFVDCSAASLAVLEKNLQPLRGDAPELEITLQRAEALRWIRERWPRASVDGILMDPPYDEPGLAAVLSALAERATELGWLALETADRDLDPPAGLELERVLRFGDTRFTLLRGGRS